LVFFSLPSFEKGIKNFHSRSNHMKKNLCTVLAILAFGFSELQLLAQMFPGGGGTNSSPAYTPLDSWSFSDSTHWTSDSGYAPVSFTNLDYSYRGNGASLVVNSTNPAWLQFNVVETNGVTNLSVDTGTVMFWFAPGSWSGTNEGGTGPGEYGRLLEVGACTPDSSLGWWSLYVDDVGANIYFSAQTNDLSSNVTTYLSAPIAWTTNYFHFVVLTYSTTNTALYLDGVLATNGPPLTVYPGPDVLANGFYIGSDSNGVYQADGLFNDVVTYNVPLDAATIQEIFTSEFTWYEISPWNTVMYALSSASSSPAFTANTYSAITGAGNLQWVASATVVNGSNACNVWITNIMATTASNGTKNVTFTIEGGWDGYAYDVFATGNLQSPITNSFWVWLGQGYHGNTYTVNVPSPNAFLILGTPQDSNGDGVTDAYSHLVSHTDPDHSQSDAYGVPYAWYIQNGLSPSSASLDPDQDGLMNYQEYLYGTNPNSPEGLAIWSNATLDIF
jgi:hypothetical protein